eukprot:2367158-Rhodomonas_salina.3
MLASLLKRVITLEQRSVEGTRSNKHHCSSVTLGPDPSLSSSRRSAMPQAGGEKFALSIKLGRSLERRLGVRSHPGLGSEECQ